MSILLFPRWCLHAAFYRRILINNIDIHVYILERGPVGQPRIGHDYSYLCRLGLGKIAEVMGIGRFFDS